MVPVTKREELPELPFRRYRPMPKIVTARQLSAAEDVPNPFAANGAFHGEPGDWKITYGTSSDDTAAICQQTIFSKTYEHVEGDKYRKKASTVIEAAQLTRPLDIVTLEGPSHGQPGDWLIIGVEGAPYFKSTYIPLD